MLSRIAILLVVFAGSLLAQNASIQGIVTDSSKATIPGATVTVTNIETGVSLNTSTGPEGRYLVASLIPGLYRIDCSAAGFSNQQVSQVRFEVNQVARLDFELRPGTVSESIEVSAAAVLLNSENTEVGQVIDSKRILEMPLNGRNYLQLAQFTAGALPGGGAGNGARGREEGQFAAVGMQMAQNNVLLDGNDNSSRTSGGPLGFQAQQVKPPVDAVGEFKVVTNNMSAEYGYRAGAKVLVTTKNGTNQLHGSLYEFLRNEKLDGANFFANRSGARNPPIARTSTEPLWVVRSLSPSFTTARTAPSSSRPTRARASAKAKPSPPRSPPATSSNRAILAWSPPCATGSMIR
ncbi:MAG: carboxypeptidase regulatory-like domain-containing protein [Bryobacterales bacterium]|nr:carboxypeptidase regulatory-like domain-containing protein [Bryobacterales bacterium]